MKKQMFCLVFFTVVKLAQAQQLLPADTFTYSVNLGLKENTYLRTVPVDLLEGYCKGYWNGYYPKREKNQCLFDDFLARFNSYQLDIPVESEICTDNYCGDAHFRELYSSFTKILKYREIIYYSASHSIVKREVLWIQVMYARKDESGWYFFNGPVFRMKEINSSGHPVFVVNKDITNTPWSLEHVFQFPAFRINENLSPDNKMKLDKYDAVEEH